MPTKHVGDISVAKPGDAGIDLKYNGKDFFMSLETIYKIHTGVYVEIPEGHCGIVFERSGLGAKYGVTIHGRIIDSGYRGELMVLMSRSAKLTCDTEKLKSSDINGALDDIPPLTIKNGDRIAQMVIVKFDSELKAVADVSCLAPSMRGATGLGSSGR